MKTKLFLALSCFVGLVSIESAHAAPTSYAMVCRGSPQFNWRYIKAGDRFEFTYNRGTRAAPGGITPGSCTWLDRGVGLSEPNKICASGAGVNYIVWRNRQQGATVTASNAPYYNQLKNPSQTFIFQVYNNGGCMQVTRLGP